MSTETTSTRRVTTYALQDAREVRTNSRMLDLYTTNTIADAQHVARQWLAPKFHGPQTPAYRIVARPGNAHHDDPTPVVLGIMTPDGWQNAITTATIAHLNDHMGNYWFSRETLRFFKGKVYGPVYGTEHGRLLFISSEKYLDERRRFAIREMEADGSIETIGETLQYATYKAAEKAIAAMLAQ